MAVEVAVGRRREQHGLGAVVDIESERERTGPAREDNGPSAGTIEGNVVAAAFERQLAQHRAVEVEHDNRVCPVGAPASGNEIAGGDARARVVVEHAGKGARGARRRNGERRADQEMPPINRHRAH